MLIVCPTCASEYRIDTARVGMEGRSVRCAGCRETWFVSPAEVLAAREAELEAEAEAAREPETAASRVSEAAWDEASAAVRDASGEAIIENVPAPPRSPRGRKSGSKAGYKPLRKGRGLVGPSPALALGLVALAAIPLACLARVPVVMALPQAAGIYARIGLPVNLRGLEIRDVAAFRTSAAGERTAELVVEGDLVGVARDGAPIPPIAVVLRDAAERTVKTYAITAPRSRLGQGETARFSGRFPDPPEQARGIEVRFADAAGPAKRADAAGH